MRRRGILLGVVTVGGALSLGCEVSTRWPAAFPASTYTKADLGQGKDPEPFAPPAAVRAKIDAALLAGFGTPAAPKLAGADEVLSEKVFHGSRLYRSQCMYCHGLGGDGNGPTAPTLEPRPRDYRRGQFKWKTTLAASKPKHDDIVRVLQDGIPGTAMPPFVALPEADLDALATYVQFLSRRGETEFTLLRWAAGEAANDEEAKEALEEFDDQAETAAKRVASAWKAPKPAPVSGTRIEASAGPAYEESVLRGRDLFLGQAAGCVKCHGADGLGNRPTGTKLTEDDLVDVWGHPARPRNLVQGQYRGGRTPGDLFRRLHQGIMPSKMPALDRTLPADKLWDIVNFLRELPGRPGLLDPSAANVKTAAAPATPDKTLIAGGR